MSISPKLAQIPMNDEQRSIVSHKSGPLLVVAGPGSGKTRSLVLLALNLLLCNDARPSDLILCTYTEKAAHEMQDRIAAMARSIDYENDLSEMRIGTIHSLCNQFVINNLHHTPLGNGYELLDEITQLVFIFECLKEICPPSTYRFFSEHWGSQQKIARKLKFFFDRIAEELIFETLKSVFPHLRPSTSWNETLACYLTHAYHNYQKVLTNNNCVDFAHIQKCAYNLLLNPTAYQRITAGLRYVLVDEYQDTNYIQEKILRLLAQATGTDNLCVVGDEDQALYRFRGATIRNIREFASSFPPDACLKVDLTLNYRSHPDIINAYNRWISSMDWSDQTQKDGSGYRVEKAIRPAQDPPDTHTTSVFTISEISPYQEAERVAELIFRLKQQERIEDYNQVAILLHSVRDPMSGAYIEALANRGISVFCPRARTYFEQPEICLMIASLAYSMRLNEHLLARDEKTASFLDFLHSCHRSLKDQLRHPPCIPLRQEILTIREELAQEERLHTTSESPLADYFYRLVFNEPFLSYFTANIRCQHLVMFSQLLKIFHTVYHYDTVTSENLAEVTHDFFFRFLRLQFNEGINLYEDPKNPFPVGHVQIMTIHQAKGLEFPVIIVGRLDKPTDSKPNDDAALRPFYEYKDLEPASSTSTFDRRRLYYVAFSRAQSLLVLTASKAKPDSRFAPLWKELPPWSNTQQLPKLVPLTQQKYNAPLPRYSFTNHIQVYTNCPRQFQYLRQYNFVPSRLSETLFGQLVHQTLEYIHRIALDGSLKTLDEQKIQELFGQICKFMQISRRMTIEEEIKSRALHQVLNYFYLNQEGLQRIQATEQNFQIEQPRYFLTGKIDLILQAADDGLEIMDFKTQKRPENDSDALLRYKEQLYLYAYALQKRTNRLPHKLYLYWTAEERKERALMQIPCNEQHVQQVHTYFDRVVEQIEQRDFSIKKLPPVEICNTCDIRSLCRKEGLLSSHV